MARAINLFRGNFSLIVVSCNYRSLRQKILTALAIKTGEQYREIEFHQIHNQLPKIWREDRQEGQLEHISALMCLGLEQSRPENIENLLLEANLFRDRFKQQIICPVVLWLNDLELRQFWVNAPELANLSAPPISFVFTETELEHHLREQVQRLFEMASDTQIPLFWQDSKIDADRESFSYHELELAMRELRTSRKTTNQEISSELEAKLNFALGRLFWRSPDAVMGEVCAESQGELPSKVPIVSHMYYQFSLDYWQKAERPIESGIVLFYLGNMWWHHSLVNGSHAKSACLKAKQFFQQAIAAFETANRLDLIAKYSRSYSGVLEQLNQWQALEKWVRSLLPLHQQSPLELSQDYGYLAKIALTKQEWQQVKEYSAKAISTIELVPAFDEESLNNNWLRLRNVQLCQYQLMLTQSYHHFNELQLAASVIEPAIASFNINYESTLYIRLLETFHDIAFAQGRYLTAFNARQTQRSLEQQYGMRAFVGAGALQPKQNGMRAFVSAGVLQPKQRVSSSITELDINGFANVGEIAASGRTQDVERLVEKVLATEHQITIIHGESGVGKSSLVNAGLIPALLQRSLIGQELLPIKIYVYTNWMKAIASAISKNDDRHQSSGLNANNLLRQLRKLAAQGTQIILIFDQFEEFFFTYDQPQERQIFIDFWQKCLTIPSLKLVISLRDDYLYLLLELESTHADIDILSRDLRYAIANFSTADAKSLIANLTEQANFPLEPNLVDELVRDLAGDRGSVRPIELQLVGSQLQDRHITTLAAYHAIGGKQRLVEKSVEEVIQACGDQAALIAKKVLFLLTDEQGKRPIRNYNELRSGVLTYSSNTEDLDLVLDILVGSGLIFLLPDISNKRYQLVHDYLVPFIRNTQEPDLLVELLKAQSLAERSRNNFNRLIKLALVGTILGLFVMTGLAFQANRQRRIAEFGEIEALVSSSKSSFLLDLQLESLTTAIQSAQKLKATDEGVDKKRIKQVTFENLQLIVYNIRERYRFYNFKKDAPFYGVKFSPDGKLFALANFDGGVYLYQNNGVLISSLVGLKTIDIRGLSFSPDGTRIASVGKGKSVRIWDIRNGKLISKFYAHDDDIRRVRFHPDGKKLLTGSKDGTVKLWDSDRGLLITSINPETLTSQNQPIKAIQDTSFSPDGNLIVIAKNTQISLWNLDGKLLANAIAHDQELYSVRFHPNGTNLLTSARGETVKLWRITNQNSQIQLAQTFKSTSDALSLAFSATGDHIAIGYQDNSIQMLNLEGTVEMKLGGHTDVIPDIDFSPDGRYILSASKDRTVRLWDLKGALLDTLYGHVSSIWSVNFNPNGKMFASGSVDKNIRLWNADGTFRQELKGHSDTVYGVSFSPDGTKLVSASNDKTVRIWDSETGKLLHVFDIHGAPLIYAAFSPDQILLATLGWDNKIKIWQWNQGNPQLLHVLDGHTGTVWSIAFSPDSKLLASTGNDQTVKIWDLQNGQNLHTMEAHLYGGLAIAYSPDGKQIASAGKDGKLKLWNAQTGVLEQIVTIRENFWTYGITFSPDGKAIATANSDKSIKIFDRGTGQLLKTLNGHIAEAYTLSYSPDGKTIVSGSRDNTLKLWNAETLSLEELVQRGCQLLDNYLEFSPTVPPEQKTICKIL